MLHFPHLFLYPLFKYYILINNAESMNVRAQALGMASQTQNVANSIF